MDSTKDSASESSAASYHRIRLAWSGGDDKYRVNINLRSQKVVKDLIVQLENEYLEGKAIESLFVVDSEGEKLKLKNTQALEGLFEPSDSLFAQVAQSNVQVQVEEAAPAAPTAPAALVFTWPAARRASACPSRPISARLRTTGWSGAYFCARLNPKMRKIIYFSTSGRREAVLKSQRTSFVHFLIVR
jgi:hypothetical protein